MLSPLASSVSSHPVAVASSQRETRPCRARPGVVGQTKTRSKKLSVGCSAPPGSGIRTKPPGLGAAFLSPAYDVDGVLELDLLRARSVGTDVAVDQAHQLGAVLTGRRVGDVEGKRLPRRDARTRPVGIEPQSGPHSSTSSAAAQPSAHRRVTDTANSASFSGGIGGVLVDRRRHATTASQHTDVITGERLRARPQSLPCAGWWSRPPARPRSGARRPPRVCLQPRVPQPVPWPARHPVPCRRRRRSLRRAPSSVDLASAMSVIQQKATGTRQWGQRRESVARPCAPCTTQRVRAGSIAA